jgi:BirA family transcriptional regulator, biotin operon repressor / biotin---[acetyl-CoA-carboxylase] ligase
MSGSPYSDLSRPPLHEAALRRALVVPGGLWTDLRVVAETGSTNADLAAAARAGAGEGTVLVAERQNAGRGRLGRVWRSPPRAGLAVSVLLRPGQPRAGAPGVAVARFGWLPLLAGVALAETVRRVSEVDALLKWPNDLLLRQGAAERKCAGVLAEAVPVGGEPDPAVILGIGLNTSLRDDELPGPEATSLLLAGAAAVDRDPLLRALLRAVERWYATWRAAAGDAVACGLREAYLLHCGTIGRQVEVQLPDGRRLHGYAEEVDDTGRLVVASADSGQRHPVAAADVVHLRGIQLDR